MKKKILSRVDIPVYILVAVFYFWLAAQIPYTHDDWDWGLNIGLTQLFTANLNARYAGNFFEVIMTRSELLRILIMGSGYFLLPMALAAAAVLGLVIVFTSSIYQELWTTGKAVSGYRKLFVNSVSGIWETVGSCLVQAKNLSFRIFEENLTLMLGITALLTLVTLLKKNVSKAIRVVFTSLNSLFFLYFLLNRYWELVGGDGWKFLISTVIFLLMTVEICLVFRHDRAQKNRLLFTWLSVAGVMLPLLVTSEHGPRMFFTSNALLILFALQLLGLALETANKKTLAVSLTAALVVTVLLSGYFGKVYYEIGEAKRERVEYIAQEVEAGSGVILIPQYPHTEFIWRPNPVNDLRVRYFKEFYGIPMETSLYF